MCARTAGNRAGGNRAESGIPPRGVPGCSSKPHHSTLRSNSSRRRGNVLCSAMKQNGQTKSEYRRRTVDDMPADSTSPIVEWQPDPRPRGQFGTRAAEHTTRLPETWSSRSPTVANNARAARRNRDDTELPRERRAPRVQMTASLGASPSVVSTAPPRGTTSGNEVRRQQPSQHRPDGDFFPAVAILFLKKSWGRTDYPTVSPSSSPLGGRR